MPIFRSRLEIQKIRSEKSEEIKEQEEEMRKLRDDLAKLEADINKVNNRIIPQSLNNISSWLQCLEDKAPINIRAAPDIHYPAGHSARKKNCFKLKAKTNKIATKYIPEPFQYVDCRK